MSIKIVHYIYLLLAFIAFILNLTANCADRLWEALVPQEFVNIGLWQIFFNLYRHRFDFYGKVYTGRRWFFSPEISMLFPLIPTPWLRFVQPFPTLSIIPILFALVMVYIVARSQTFGKVSIRNLLGTSFLTSMYG